MIMEVNTKNIEITSIYSSDLRIAENDNRPLESFEGLLSWDPPKAYEMRYLGNLARRANHFNLRAWRNRRKLKDARKMIKKSQELAKMPKAVWYPGDFKPAKFDYKRHRDREDD